MLRLAVVAFLAIVYSYLQKEVGMPKTRISMRKIREVLRLSEEFGLSQRHVAGSVRLGQSTVSDYLARFRASGLSLKEAFELEEGLLEERLFPPPPANPDDREPPDCCKIHQELKRKSVTLRLLWQEYREDHPEGYGYSRYCSLYRRWRRQLKVSYRHSFVGGEKLFVDYAGQTVPIVDAKTGESSPAQIFVAVLGASNYTYAEATKSQGLKDWIGSHVRTFEALGGVPRHVIPDNLKSGVTKANWYEPDVNQTYTEMAEHYDVAVLPARVRKPQDKAKVENGVLQVERWILARLRDQRFFSLHELNASIHELLKRLNARPMKGLGASRRDLFERVDVGALGALPAQPYDFADWKKVRVGPDYHVELCGHHYSVPYQHVREQLDLRSTDQTVEVFRRGKRVAGHRRSSVRGGSTTERGHMPKSHQEYTDWTPQRLTAWSEKTGPWVHQLVTEMMSADPHPERSFRPCLGFVKLAKLYGVERLEAASERTLKLGSLSYKSVKSMLEKGIEQAPLESSLQEVGPVIAHCNVRGASYYRGGNSEEVQPC